ncbi:hypothetical protein B4144_2186 [Bacillus atrophaeus]|nr:hypothetical protein D068_cds29520 [Bacillus atrophaeus UCMB-5137]KYD01707.1 hypothetical protein B4144_2186 [Bacillus atrophaeus]
MAYEYVRLFLTLLLTPLKNSQILPILCKKFLISGQKMLVTWYHNNNENDSFSQYIY